MYAKMKLGNRGRRHTLGGEQKGDLEVSIVNIFRYLKNKMVADSAVQTSVFCYNALLGLLNSIRF